jgi:hypothetical protein
MNLSELNSGLSFLVYVLFGAFGLGYFVYGKRQNKIVPLVCGICLMIYPYFVRNSILLVTIGCILLAMHVKTGYSAKSLAYCWEEAQGFPKSVVDVFNSSAFELFHSIELMSA